MQKVLLAERQKAILDLISKQGKVYALELAETLNVSIDTVRRDLNQLGNKRLLKRVHGGAMALKEIGADYADRVKEIDEVKQQLALNALPLIKAGDVIWIDSGTSCRYLAAVLPEDLVITVVTSSPVVAVELMKLPSVDVILLGGRVYKPAMRCVGGVAEQIRNIKFDVAFFGVYAFSYTGGVMVNNYEESVLIQAAVEQAGEVVIMLAKDKLGVDSTYTAIKPASIDRVLSNTHGEYVVSLPQYSGVNWIPC